MLKVVASAEYDGEIEWFSPDYTPPIFNIRVGRSRSEPTAVWRVEPPRATLAESSLLDVYVHRSDGSLRDIEFSGIRKDWIEFVDDDFRFLSEGVKGVPIVDTMLWEDTGQQMRKGAPWPRVIERMPLRLFVGKDACSLQIGEATESSKVVAFDRFRLGLDRDRNLGRIDVIGLSPEKIRDIRQYRESPPGGIPPTKPGLLRLLRWETGMLLRRLRWTWLLNRSG